MQKINGKHIKFNNFKGGYLTYNCALLLSEILTLYIQWNRAKKISISPSNIRILFNIHKNIQISIWVFVDILKNTG